MTQNNLQYDIQISSSEVDKEELAEFTKLDHVTESIIIEEAHFETFIDMDELPDAIEKANTRERYQFLRMGNTPIIRSA